MKDSSKDKSEFLPKRWVDCDVEANYFGDRRKESKEERKRAVAKDRSQFKKSDIKKKQKLSLQNSLTPSPSPENALKGLVTSITSRGIQVQTPDNALITCILKGILKKDTQPIKNLVTVGDEVLYQLLPGEEGVILQILPRRSVLSRADNLSRRKQQLIAANVDQVLITVSVVFPALKPFLIDRYVIAAQKGGLQPIVVVNKIDLLDDESKDPVVREVEAEVFQDLKLAYEKANIPFFGVSIVQKKGLEPLIEIMKDKISVFSGQSGVGKSSLINVLTGKDLKTGGIVGKTGKGSHTTTTTQLIPLVGGGWCIDTPGIKSFGVWDLQRDEVQAHFVEIQALAGNCKFNSCTHMHEDGCAVLDAVEKGSISSLRYTSYCLLIEGLNDEHVRR